MSGLLHTLAAAGAVLGYCLLIAACVWCGANLIDRGIRRVHREQRGRSRWG